MVETLVTHFMQMLCRHSFSWPHSSIDGRDYQVCVICGSAYEYDWRTMRRTRRLASPLNERVEFDNRPAVEE
ncbi:MAG TPA: hypothetical protein VEI49_04005 [Terriglobales bacterium]|nr:hypothetical protein [Terriglobales bacterium]